MKYDKIEKLIEVKINLLQAMKAQRRSRGIVLPFL
jgi:hypothetical protein